MLGAPEEHEPKFKIGDRVISFRGEKATVVTYRSVPDPGKSDRVRVRFDGDDEATSIEYYDKVFEKIQEA